MFVKRFKRRQILESDEFLEVMQYPCGAPLIVGGDKAYAVFNAVSMALVMLQGFQKVQPKKAKQLQPVSAVWHKLYDELRPYADLVEEKNMAGD